MELNVSSRKKAIHPKQIILTMIIFRYMEKKIRNMNFQAGEMEEYIKSKGKTK